MGRVRLFGDYWSLNAWKWDRHLTIYLLPVVQLWLASPKRKKYFFNSEWACDDNSHFDGLLTILKNKLSVLFKTKFFSLHTSEIRVDISYKRMRFSHRQISLNDKHSISQLEKTAFAFFSKNMKRYSLWNWSDIAWFSFCSQNNIQNQVASHYPSQSGKQMSTVFYLSFLSWFYRRWVETLNDLWSS